MGKIFLNKEVPTHNFYGGLGEMKQKKGKDYKITRQWTDEDRIAKKRLMESIKPAIIKGEFDEDKLDPSTPKKEKGK